jgi:hypothetical protein
VQKSDSEPVQTQGQVCNQMAIVGLIGGLPKVSQHECERLVQAVLMGEADALAMVECDCFNGISRDHAGVDSLLSCKIFEAAEYTIVERVRQCWAGTHPSQVQDTKPNQEQGQGQEPKRECNQAAIKELVDGLPQASQNECGGFQQAALEQNVELLASVECDCFNGIPKDHVEMKANTEGTLSCRLFTASEYTIEERIRQCWAGNHSSYVVADGDNQGSDEREPACDCSAQADELQSDTLEGDGSGTVDHIDDLEVVIDPICEEQGAKDCAVDCVLCVRPKCGPTNIMTAACPISCIACAMYVQCDKSECPKRTRRKSECVDICIEAASKTKASSTCAAPTSVTFAAVTAVVVVVLL